MSGCDYIENIKGIGLKSAIKIVRDAKKQSIDGESFLEKIFEIIKN